ncbi:MAG: ECF transporter S component [Limnochordia bacterium]|nr:ECF transporter S component [Bacillota bacterium]HOK32847.1 ECF transporter S component [Limnochordia bacterium]HOM01172.1 ECF transporter S component [Limnochordia bacterium]HOQ73455.1 ECF transporter S component [Limnochordia bacterium]HPP71911.1 ECF transporter S component [Limnochordia bacterium]
MIHNASQTRGSLFATSAMVKMGMLAAIGMVLMLVDFPLPLFPSFLQIDLSDVPAVIGAFSLGPAAGVVIELLKNLLKLIVGSNTGGVGELANFLVGAGYVLPLALIYQRWPSRSGVLWGSVTATVAAAVFAGVLNYFIFVPAYAAVMGVPVDAFVQAAAKVNAAVVDLRTMVVFAIVPFNLIKGVIIAVASLVVYRILRPLWERF